MNSDSHWVNLHHSDWRAKLVKDVFLDKFSTIKSHVIYNPAYTDKFQLKTTCDNTKRIHWLH